MSFLVAPVLAEIGTLVSTSLVELGITETVAGVAGTGVVNSLTNSINEQALETAKELIGEDNVEYFEQTKEQASNIAFGILSGNPESYVKYELDKTHDKHTVIDPTQTTNKSHTSTETKQKVNALISGKDVGEFLVKQASEYANNSVQEHIKDLIGIDLGTTGTKTIENITKDLITSKDGSYDNKTYTLAQRLSNWTADKSLSKSPEFRELFKVYNGTGISPENVVMTEDSEKWMFYIYDETGTLVSLEQYKNAFTLPSVYGVFGGAMSKNNSMPVDVPDTCFLCHDADYSSSYFSWKSDMKLVSRLVQVRDKWPIESVNQLNGIVIYFATIGASLAVVKGSLFGDPSESTYKDTKDDMFDAMVPEAITLSEIDYKIHKQEFYESFHKGIEGAVLEHSPIGSNSYSQKLKNITIDIL